MLFTRLLALVMLLSSATLSAEPAEPAQTKVFTPPPSVISTESMLQIFVGLLVVLALIGLLAWLFKKSGIYTANQSGLIRIIASASVGQKERIVLTEINDTWLVLGVAPGHISLLHSIEKSEIVTSPVPDSAEKTRFSDKLRANLRQDHAQ